MPAIVNSHICGHPLHDGKAWNAAYKGHRLWPALTESEAASLTDRWIASPPRAYAPSSRATLAGSKITITHAVISGGILILQ